jgi:hypothetical protein
VARPKIGLIDEHSRSPTAIKQSSEENVKNRRPSSHAYEVSDKHKGSNQEAAKKRTNLASQVAAIQRKMPRSVAKIGSSNSHQREDEQRAILAQSSSLRGPEISHDDRD